MALLRLKARAIQVVPVLHTNQIRHLDRIEGTGCDVGISHPEESSEAGSATS